MSKIKIAVVVLFIAVILNIGILRFVNFSTSNTVVLNMDLLSNNEDTYQVYYSIDENFEEDRSIKTQYTTVDKNKILEFPIPSETNYIRIDFGTMPSNIEIRSLYFKYGNEKIEVDLDLMSNSTHNNMINSIMHSNGKLSVITDGIDPYSFIDITEINLERSVYKIQQKSNNMKKVILCMIVSMLLLSISVNIEKIIILIRELYNNRKLIINLSLNDFKTKYAGSYLGIIWAFIQPIVTVLVYWFVFQVGFRSGTVNDFPYVLWLISGLIPWFFFSDAIMGASNSLIEYSYLVKKVVFKISVLPIVKIVSALYVHVFFVSFMILMFMLNGYMPDIYILQVPYYSLCMIILAVGISYATCSIIIFIRDLGQIIGIILQIGMWMTPILWNYTMIPQKYKWIYNISPVYYIIKGYRDALIHKVWFWEDISLTIYFWIITIGVFSVGALIFKRLRIHFADVL